MFRRFRGVEDTAALAALLNAAWQADRVERITTAEEVVRLYAPRPAFDPAWQMMLAEVDGVVVGMAQHHWLSLRDGKQVYGHRCAVAPNWRGQGIEQALLQWNERRLRAIARERRQSAPADGAPPEQVLAWPDWVQEKAAIVPLLVSEGYQPVRYHFDMLCPALDRLPEAPLPAGVEVQPVESSHYPAIYSAYKEAFADAFDSTSPSEAEYQRWLQRPFARSSELCRVAWADDQVAGLVLCSINAAENERYGRLRGSADAVCIRPAWRGRGLARALLVQALHALREQGMTEAVLMVDTQNAHGALRLYEGVGFRIVIRRALYSKPLEPETVL
jgi:mycothiol synthase